MNILVSGLVNTETSVRVREFPVPYFPIDYPFFGVSSVVGGVGYNISRALKSLGDSVSFVSFAGDDVTFRTIKNQLESDGISSVHIQNALKATAQSVVLYDPSGRREIYCDLKDIQEQRLDVLKIRPLVKNADIVCACNINFNRTLLHEAKRLGKLVATDVHVLSDPDDEYNREFLENADIVFLSDEALPCPAEEFISVLKNKYPAEIIVMGRGARGATMYERATDSIRSFDAVPPEKVVNTVGAGDALFSSFVHFYAKGLGAQNALCRAQIFASAKIGSNGASLGFLTEEEVEKRV